MFIRACNPPFTSIMIRAAGLPAGQPDRFLIQNSEPCFCSVSPTFPGTKPRFPHCSPSTGTSALADRHDTNNSKPTWYAAIPHISDRDV